MRYLLVTIICLIVQSSFADIYVADVSDTNENWSAMPEFVQAPNTWQWSVSPSFFFWMGAGLATGCAYWGILGRRFSSMTSTTGFEE